MTGLGKRLQLVEGLGVEGNIFFPSGFLLRVSFHPGFPAFSGGCIATGEGECRDIGVGDGYFFVRVLGEETDDRISESASAAAVKEVTFDFASVFAGDGNVAAIVEGFFERDAAFFFGREIRDPALKLFMLSTRRYFESLGIRCIRVGWHCVRGGVVDVSSFFASHSSLDSKQSSEAQPLGS